MRFKRNDTRKIRASVEMTPLIDVVFQLLIFFMLSSTFVVQTSIPIEIPESSGAEQLEEKEVSITLQQGKGGPDEEGRIFVNEVEINNWDELTSTMSELQSRKPDALVLIRADKDVPTGRTVKIMGLLNGLGIQHYGIAAQSPQGED